MNIQPVSLCHIIRAPNVSDWSVPILCPIRGLGEPPKPPRTSDMPDKYCCSRNKREADKKNHSALQNIGKSQTRHLFKLNGLVKKNKTIKKLSIYPFIFILVSWSILPGNVNLKRTKMTPKINQANWSPRPHTMFLWLFSKDHFLLGGLIYKRQERETG